MGGVDNSESARATQPAVVAVVGDNNIYRTKQFVEIRNPYPILCHLAFCPICQDLKLMTIIDKFLLYNILFFGLTN